MRLHLHVQAKAPAEILAALVALVWHNLFYLITHPGVPPLYTSGVRYIGQRPGFEDWLTIPYARAEGGGDCKVLCGWRIAELRREGEDARPVLKRIAKPEEDKISWHVLVERADGSIEDPSIELGMRDYFSIPKEERPVRYYPVEEAEGI